MQGIAASTATVEIENQNRIQLEVEERRGKPSFWRQLQMLLVTKGSMQNKFSVKVGILAQPAWPPPRSPKVGIPKKEKKK